MHGLQLGNWPAVSDGSEDILKSVMGSDLIEVVCETVPQAVLQAVLLFNLPARLRTSVSHYWQLSVAGSALAVGWMLLKLAYTVFLDGRGEDVHRTLKYGYLKDAIVAGWGSIWNVPARVWSVQPVAEPRDSV